MAYVFPTICHILADCLHEQTVPALALFCDRKRRLESKFIRDYSASLRRLITMPVIRAYQGHKLAKSEAIFGEGVNLWRKVPQQVAKQMLVAHGTSVKAASEITQTAGTMKAKENRACLHLLLPQIP